MASEAPAGATVGRTATSSAPDMPSASTRRPKAARNHISARMDAETVIVFLIGKLIAYTALGFALGFIGKAFQITPGVQAALLIGAGVFMVVMALNLFGVKAVHLLVPAPPASWTRLVRREAKSSSPLAPFFLGCATVLLPCGVTISMEVAAVATGSPVLGAAVMAAFVLGTVPLFFMLGFAAHRLSTAWGGRLSAVTGAVVLIAALFAINSGMNLSGSPVTLASMAGLGGRSVEAPTTQSATGSQRIVIQATSTAYTPNVVSAKPGVPIDVVIHSVGATGCIRSFLVPQFGVNEVLPENGDTAIKLPALKPGTYRFMCGMGMYSGIIRVAA